MADTETPTWRQAQLDAETAGREWADDYWDDATADAGDAGHEYADSCADVIYTYRVRAIWADSADVQEYETDVADIVDNDADIDRRMTLCVYLAIRDAFAGAAAFAMERNRNAAANDTEVTA